MRVSRKQWVGILQYVLFLGLGLFLLWWSIRGLSAENRRLLSRSLREANYLLVIPAMVLLLFSHYSRAVRWKLLMEPLGYRPATFNVFIATMLGYFYNLLMPRLGEVMKCTMLARYEKVPVDRLIGTMVAERAFDFICLLLIVFLTIVTQLDVVADMALEQWNLLMRTGDGGINWTRLLIAGIVILLLVFALRIVFTRFSHIGLVRQVRNLFRGIWEGLISVRYLKKRWAFLGHTVFIWGMYLLSIRIGFYAMPEVTHLGMTAALSVLTFGSLAMIVTQGGIGAYQYAVQKTLYLYDVQEGMGLGFGWVLWTAQTLIVLGLGIACLIILPIYNRHRHASAPTHSSENLRAS